AVLVLSEESELPLHHLSRPVVFHPDDDGAYAIDHLGQVGDGDGQAMRDALTGLGGEPLEDPPHSRLHRKPGIVDRGRTVEVVAVEVLELLFRSGGLLLRHDEAARQPEARESYEYRHERRCHHECSPTRTAPVRFHDASTRSRITR